MKFKRLTLIILFSLAMTSVLSAQATRQVGVIRGIITDNTGAPIPGVAITAESPALMGSATSITDATGLYRLINLPPGTYTVTASLTGFKTVKQPGIIVQAGQTYTINLQTESSPLAEEITVTAAAPMVDMQSNKITYVTTTEFLKDLPIARNINQLFNITAGSNATIGAYTGSIHGANSGSTAYEIDGVNGENPTIGGMQLMPQYESIEEIEIATGGLPAQVGASGGSFISVVTKSGGNEFHGQAQFYYTAQGLNQMLFTNEELNSFKRSKPNFAKYDTDLSVSLGGPIFKDKLWFFGTLEYHPLEYAVSFEPVTIEGTMYEPYSNPYKTWFPFLKLTYQINKDLRLFVMYNGTSSKNIYDAGRYVTLDATTLSNSTLTGLTAELTWTLGPNTYVSFRGGWNDLYWTLTGQPDSAANIGKYDRYTTYTWNGKRYEEQYTTRRGESLSARLTHYLDGVLGGDHEIGAGIEYVYSFDRLTVAKPEPLTMYYYKGNPYYYAARGYPRDTYGDGWVEFANQGPKEGDSTKLLPGNRIGAYLQDSFTYKNRLTFNLGARLDWYWGGSQGGTSTGTDPNGVAYKVGEFVAKTIGWNPYAAMTWDPIPKTMDFVIVSPRIGATYDLFGNGKTALKVSWGRYYEAMPVMWFAYAQPYIQAHYPFRWWDDNGNKVCDDPGIDTYYPDQGYAEFQPQDPESLRQMVAGPGDPHQLKAPWNNELIISISHEVAKNFTVKLAYINKLGRRNEVDANWNRVTETYVNWLDTAPAGFWVPFTTIVPANGAWPEKEITVYVPTANYDWENIAWGRQSANPHAKRQYNGIELTFDKRYAKGWALGGSITYAKSKQQTAWDANDLINGYGADINDIPLAIKLYGSFTLPLDFIASFIYRHQSGGPLNFGQVFWGKAYDVFIRPPYDWLVAHNCIDWWGDIGVMLEPNGAHRQASWDNVDFRLEKEFKFKYGTFSIFADIYNLLGNKYVNTGLDPWGVWAPTGENTTSGTIEPAYNYQQVTSVSGVRTFRLSGRFAF